MRLHPLGEDAQRRVGLAGARRALRNVRNSQTSGESATQLVNPHLERSSHFDFFRVKGFSGFKGFSGINVFLG
jgi:hypothetical protein